MIIGPREGHDMNVNLHREEGRGISRFVWQDKGQHTGFGWGSGQYLTRVQVTWEIIGLIGLLYLNMSSRTTSDLWGEKGAALLSHTGRRPRGLLSCVTRDVRAKWYSIALLSLFIWENRVYKGEKWIIAGITEWAQISVETDINRTVISFVDSIINEKEKQYGHLQFQFCI